MKIPKRVKVGPFAYSVVYRDDPRDDDERRLCGQCRHMDEQIILRGGMTPTHTLETFFHEVLHAIEHAMEIDLGEKRLARLSMGLTAVLLDNRLLREE